jgi:hypothetical protein
VSYAKLTCSFHRPVDTHTEQTQDQVISQVSASNRQPQQQQQQLKQQRQALPPPRPLFLVLMAVLDSAGAGQKLFAGTSSLPTALLVAGAGAGQRAQTTVESFEECMRGPAGHAKRRSESR